MATKQEKIQKEIDLIKAQGIEAYLKTRTLKMDWYWLPAAVLAGFLLGGIIL